MIYAAYGSNTNIKQMRSRCPSAKIIGVAKLNGYKLLFRRGYLTLLKSDGDVLDVLLWDIDENDLKYLDMYEGYPTLYYRKSLGVTIDNEMVMAIFYIMCEQYISDVTRVSPRYKCICAKGYIENGMCLKQFDEALDEVKNKIF
jgi:gamma-glutamylcyclotransferase (GGCT)/AIG2-like uncharacterized protein YtfP|nr:MAG TPA: hypothetical protein [Caudoviricetes sp.]